MRVVSVQESTLRNFCEQHPSVHQVVFSSSTIFFEEEVPVQRHPRTLYFFPKNTQQKDRYTMLLMDARRFFLIVLLPFLPTINAEPYRDYATSGSLSESSFIPRTKRNGGPSYYSDNDEMSVDYDINSSEQRDHRSPSNSSYGRIKRQVSSDRQVHWNFGYRNTDEWGQHHPECYGSRQSPINLNSNMMTRLNVSSPFTWNGYWATPRKMTLTNNGHTVQLNAFWDNKGDVPYISGGTLVGDYAFHQLHFHWGSSDGTGSEHTVNNRSLPLEMHMVHYNKAYGSADEAGKHEDGLVVVGIFFELGKTKNKGIKNLQKHTGVAIKNPNSTVQIWPFPLSKFSVKFSGEYVSYLGSLTTPPCSEIVTWVLPVYSRFITRAQLNIFRRIRLADRDSHNYRPTQPLKGRMVYYIAY